MEISKDTIMRAWKDESFRASLGDDERAAIPDRPTAADGSELSDAELESAAGGATPLIVAGGLIAGYGTMEILD